MTAGEPLPLFDECTAVRPGGAGGVWDVELRDEFTIVNGRPNGGYLLALLGRAAVLALGEPDRHVISATASYVAPPAVGPATVRTEVQRRGRTASQVRTVLVQDDTPRVEVLMLVGALDSEPPVWGDVAAPTLPDEETCQAASEARRSPITGGEPPMAKVVSLAFDPATLGWAAGEPGGQGEMRAWVRFADNRPFDPLALLLAVDALPPATFEVAMTGWVPTLSLTAYIRARPAPGPLRVRFRVGVIAGGRADETCEVWDSAGRLVAQSTQLAAIRMP